MTTIMMMVMMMTTDSSAKAAFRIGDAKPLDSGLQTLSPFSSKALFSKPAVYVFFPALNGFQFPGRLAAARASFLILTYLFNGQG